MFRFFRITTKHKCFVVEIAESFSVISVFSVVKYMCEFG